MLCLALSLAGLACSSTSRVYIRSTEVTNNGRTLYVMVRSADAKSVTGEQYRDVAATVFVDPPDRNVLLVQPVFPGDTVSLSIDEADAQDIIVYAFYTQPGQNWRVPIYRPLPAEVYIELGQHQITRVQVRKR
jgi:hypothetical protein